jgi:hypothetical protein
MLGSYFKDIYQMGYVTRDLDRAKRRVMDVMGVTSFHDVNADFPVRLRGRSAQYRIRGALANLGDKQIELIEPMGDVEEFYTEGLDLDTAVMRLHHVGILVAQPSDAWSKLSIEAEKAGYPIVLEGGNEEFFCFTYADSRADLGHYVEFLGMTDAALAWHRSLPDQTAQR